jgi:hypothetical protein
MKISLVGPSYTLQSVVAAAQQTMNLYPETLAVADEPRRQVFFGRPGLKFFAQLTPTKIRCLWTGGGRVFAIHNGTQSEVFQDGTSTPSPKTVAEGVGTPDPAQIFSNGHQLMIISGGWAYCDNGSGPEPARFLLSGTGHTNTNVLARDSGPPFTALMAGMAMTINGKQYNVISFTDADHLLIDPFAPIETGVPWSIAAGDQVDAITGGILDGYFIVGRMPSTNPALQAQGRTFNISELNEGTIWDPLAFGVKEGYSDLIRSVLCDHEELWLFGTTTTEVWTNIGSTLDAAGVATFPFQRMAGAFIQDGSAATFAPCSVGMYTCWLGGGTDGQTVAYRALAFQPERISTHAQEESWNSPGVNVKDAVSYAYFDAGHLFWVVNFWAQAKTWVYDMTEGLWHERAGWNPLTTQFTRYQPWYHVFVPEWGIGGKHIVGDPATGKLYEQSLNYYDDDGAAIEYIRCFPHLMNEDKNLFHHRIEFYMDTGTVVSPVPQMKVGLDWSDDRGHNFTGVTPLQLSGAPGEYTKRIVWRRLGRARDRVYRFGVNGKGKVALIDAFLEVTPGTS